MVETSSFFDVQVTVMNVNMSYDMCVGFENINDLSQSKVKKWSFNSWIMHIKIKSNFINLDCQLEDKRKVHKRPMLFYFYSLVLFCKN